MSISNRIFGNPNTGVYNHRKEVQVIDKVATILPVNSTADGVVLQDGDRVLFTNLSSPNNNKIFKLKKGVFEVAIDSTDSSGKSKGGDVVYVIQGTSGGSLYAYEGTWELLDVDTDAGGDVNSASNVGGANGIYKQKTNGNLELKTLAASTNIAITPVGDTLVISNTGPDKTYVDAFGGTAFVPTAGGTTVFTVSSPRDFVPFGTLAENYQLPSTALLQVGNWWRCTNRSTQSVTIKNASGGTITTVPPQTVAHIRVTATGSESFAVYGQPIYSSVDGSLSFLGFKGVSLANGTNPTDAVNKSQLDTKQGWGFFSPNLNGSTYQLTQSQTWVVAGGGTADTTLKLPVTAGGVLPTGTVVKFLNKSSIYNMLVQDATGGAIVTVPFSTGSEIIWNGGGWDYYKYTIIPF